MTTTLSSAGGVSFVTDGTGPTLQIKGLSGGTGVKIDSTSTVLIPRLKRISETQRFSDDFLYHTYGTDIGLGSFLNPFIKSNVWYTDASSGVGLSMVETKEWPGGGFGVIRFRNNVSTGSGSWALKAKDVSFGVGGSDLTYEATLFFDTPSSNGWQFKVGLLNSSIELLGFDLNPSSNSYVQTVTPAGTTGTSTTISSLYGQWVNFKITVNAALTSIQFYLNDTLVNTRSSLSSTYYIPVIYASRSGTISSFTFYIDYIDIIKDSR